MTPSSNDNTLYVQCSLEILRSSPCAILCCHSINPGVCSQEVDPYRSGVCGGVLYYLRGRIVILFSSWCFGDIVVVSLWLPSETVLFTGKTVCTGNVINPILMWSLSDIVKNILCYLGGEKHMHPWSFRYVAGRYAMKWISFNFHQWTTFADSHH